MSLREEIAKRRQAINTDAYSMSIGELTNLYRDDELDIHPEFQRFFRWSDEQKSRLIESLLLGIPIPSIFVQQRQDGVWDVIDGLQRLSTIFELQGLLKDEQERVIPPLILRGTKYLPSLEGKKWEDDTGDSALDREQQLLIKRSKLDVQIVLRESDEASKYELFQRLNTGGSPLSDQELRNCILIMVNRDFYHWLVALAKDPNFKSCIALTDRALEEQYDIELIVRFIVLRRVTTEQLRKVGDIGEFLTDELVQLAQSEEFDRDREAAAFHFTFERLAEALQDSAFKRYDSSKRRFLGGFLLSVYEVLALGLGANYEEYEGGIPIPDIHKIAQELWSDEQFRSRTGSGIRASSRLPYTIPMGRKYFRP
jgi:hypothetical protein